MTAAGAERATFHLGLRAERAGLIVRASFEGEAGRASAARVTAIDVIGAASSQRELLEGLRELAGASGFRLEVEPVSESELTVRLSEDRST
ncbi:MAG TPA: hypothetical protein VF763_11445 [Candidatus Limnocylindrales bacterium]